jgi:molybdopterin converting factor small subunit
MEIKILLFGQLADVIGADSITLENVKDTTQLVQQLKNLYPSLAELPYAIAVDMNFVNENTSLNHDSVIALLPPYSGG